MDFSQIRKLKDRTVKPGEAYILAAGFDVKLDLKDTERIDQEIPDIKQISDSGGVVAILSHKGRLAYNDATHLDFVADYLSERLGKHVGYFPSNNTREAQEHAKGLEPGSVALFGNTRFHQGETKNDPVLAEQFSMLGEFVVIGGFCKAHRKHASNYGILEHKPGFLAESCINQMTLLEPWEGRKPQHSVAVLGGIKKEKIQALGGFAEIYDFLIPGGITLNTILKVRGVEIGDSLIEDEGRTFEPEVEEILKHYAHKIYLPKVLRVAKKTDNGFGVSFLVPMADGVPQGFAIVDFELGDYALSELERAVRERGRILLAGTPGVYKQGFTTATNQVLEYLEDSRVDSLVLGGDTVNEVPFSGTSSIGGGSALEYLCTGDLAICEGLKRNKIRFPDV